MDEEKGLVSPILGGIRAIRRKISSNMFVPRRQNEPQKPDPVTTNLLTTQSLQLRNVSRQLELISNTMVGINLSLNGVKESLALSQQLENQREQAKRNRERQLAEQGLREGKESALEKKIQGALQLPLKRVAAKAQGVLFNFQKFFLFLAGGWLTNVGIDLINALVTGNTELINKLKLKFTVGLVAIGATFTAFNVGFKLIFNSLATFVKIITRLTFGGIIKTTLAGFRLLLKNVAIRAGLFRAAPVGFFGGNSGALAAGATGAVVSGGISTNIDDTLDKLADDIGKGKKKTTKDFIKKRLFDPNAKNKFRINPSKNRIFREIPKRLRLNESKILKKMPKFGFLGRANVILQALNAINIFNERSDKGQGELQATTGTVAETIGGIAGFSLGIKGFVAGMTLFGLKAAPIFAIPVVGPILWGIGSIVAGSLVALFGQKALGFLTDRIFGFLKIGKKKKDKDLPELTFEDFEVVPVSSLSEEDQKKLGVFEPVKKELVNLQEEESSSVTTIPLANDQANNSNNMVAQKRESSALPGISFNDNNPHTMYSVMQMGVA
tara:strand:- start:210 stop:1871 length:1662 start_codon:yes stop_codon:yes gene_type:complete